MIKMDAQKVIELWDKYEMYDCIREHSILVAAMSVKVAEILLSRGERINVDLVKYGALFHDIAKKFGIEGENEGSHNEHGEHILLREGLHDYSVICREHYLNYISSKTYSNMESFVVNFSDKLADSHGYVTLKKRFESFYVKYPKYGAEFDKSYIIFEELFNVIFEDEEKYLEITNELKEKLDMDFTKIGSSIDPKKSKVYEKIIEAL